MYSPLNDIKSKWYCNVNKTYSLFSYIYILQISQILWFLETSLLYTLIPFPLSQIFIRQILTLFILNKPFSPSFLSHAKW